jgi:hypothetical protein
MISDDYLAVEARSPELGDERVDVQRIQVGNQADLALKYCWVRMYVAPALVGIGGGSYLLVSLGALKVGWKSAGQMDLDIGVGSDQCP